MEPVFVLYSCCIPVKGAKRSTVCDIQRSKYYFIPNALYTILTSTPGLSIEKVKDEFGIEHGDTIDEYFKFLTENELGFFTTEPDRFPPISMEWHHPSEITNAIIDISGTSNHPYEKIFRHLDELGCAAVQLRFYDHVNVVLLDEVLAYTDTSRIRAIELLLPYSEEYSFETIEKLCQAHTRITYFVLHSAGIAHSRYYNSLKLMVTHLVDKITDATHCGIIHPGYFTTNISLFTESQSFNSCLNRKISIDAEGKIKQCPSMKKDFGNILERDLKDAINLSGFKDAWYINKDKIEICRDCEFRYVCTDCRAYTAQNNLYAKPAGCSYDPYKAKWENENDNPKNNNFIKHKVEII